MAFREIQHELVGKRMGYVPRGSMPYDPTLTGGEGTYVKLGPDPSETETETAETPGDRLRRLRDAHADARLRLAAAERSADEDAILEADRAERAAAAELEAARG